MDSYTSRLNPENAVRIYDQSKRHPMISKRASGTRNYVRRAYIGNEGLEIPEQAAYSRSSKALKPPKVNEYRPEKPDTRKSARQNVFIDSYYPIVSGDLSEDCEGSKKSHNFNKDSNEDLPRKNEGGKSLRKSSESEAEENHGSGKPAKGFQDKKKHKKPPAEERQEPERLIMKKSKAINLQEGIVKIMTRPLEMEKPPLRRDISEMTFDSKTYTVNSCVSDKDVTIDETPSMETNSAKYTCAKKKTTCLVLEPTLEYHQKPENIIKIVEAKQITIPKNWEGPTYVAASLEANAENYECRNIRIIEDPTVDFHQKPLNENMIKIVEAKQIGAPNNCNNCETLSAIDCFAQLYKRIETLEGLLQKTLAHTMSVKKIKSKSKSGTRQINSPENYEMYSESKLSPSGVWFLDTPSASESSTAKEKVYDSEDSDTDSELRKIKKRLKVLERKLRVLSSTCNGLLFTDGVIRDSVKEIEATKPFLVEAKKFPGRKLYFLSKVKGTDVEQCCAGNFSTDNSRDRDKVKSFLSKYKRLKRKCSSLISSSRNSSWENSYPLSISNEILYERSVVTQKSVERTLNHGPIPPNIVFDKDEEESLTKLMFLRRCQQKKSQECDMKIKKKKIKKKRRPQKEFHKKNSKTNVSLTQYKVSPTESKCERGGNVTRNFLDGSEAGPSMIRNSLHYDYPRNNPTTTSLDSDNPRGSPTTSSINLNDQKESSTFNSHQRKNSNRNFLDFDPERSSNSLNSEDIIGDPTKNSLDTDGKSSTKNSLDFDPSGQSPTRNSRFKTSSKSPPKNFDFDCSRKSPPRTLDFDPCRKTFPTNPIDLGERVKSPTRNSIDLKDSGKGLTRNSSDFDHSQKSPTRNSVDFDPSRKSPTRDSHDFNDREKSPNRNSLNFDPSRKSPTRNSNDLKEREKSPTDSSIDSIPPQKIHPKNSLDLDVSQKSPTRNSNDLNECKRIVSKKSLDLNSTRKSSAKNSLGSNSPQKSPMRNSIELGEQKKSPTRNSKDFVPSRESPARNSMDFDPSRKSPTRNSMDFDPSRKSPTRTSVDFDPSRKSPTRNSMDFDPSRKSPTRNSMDFDPSRKSPTRNSMDFDLSRKSPTRNSVDFDPSRKSPTRNSMDFDPSRKSPTRTSVDCDPPRKSPTRTSIDSDPSRKSPTRNSMDFDPSRKSPTRNSMDFDPSRRSPTRTSVDFDPPRKSPTRTSIDSDPSRKSPTRNSMDFDPSRKSPTRNSMDFDPSRKSPTRNSVHCDPPRKSPTRNSTEFDPSRKSPTRNSIELGEQKKNLTSISLDFDHSRRSPTRNSQVFNQSRQSPARNSLDCEASRNGPTRNFKETIDQEGDSSTSSLVFENFLNSPTRNYLDSNDLRGSPSGHTLVLGNQRILGDLNGSPPETRENSDQSFERIKQTPRAILAQDCPEYDDGLQKRTRGSGRSNPLSPDSSLDSDVEAPRPVRDSFPGRSCPQASFAGGEYPWENPRLIDEEEEKPEKKPGSCLNAMEVLKSGGRIKIPVLFEKLRKKPGKKKTKCKASDISLRFVVVEGDIENPMGTLKKMVKKYSKAQPSPEQSEQYIFGMSKCCAENQEQIKGIVSEGKMSREPDQSWSSFRETSLPKTIAPGTLFLGLTILSLAIALSYRYWRNRHFYKLAALIDGPKGLPIVGNALEYLSLDHVKILDYLLEITTKYKGLAKIWLGNILLVHISRPEDMEILLSSNKLIEKNVMYKFFDDVLGQGLLNARGDIWRKHRKIIAPTFHPTILKHFVKIFSEQSKILVNVLEKKADGKIFNVFPYIRNCALDFITETAMENHIGAQLRVVAPATSAAERLMNITYNRMFKLWLYSDSIFYRTQQGKEYLKLIEIVKGATEPLLEVKKKEMAEQDQNQNINEDTKRKSFFRQLVKLNENGENFNDQELRDEVITMVITGYETTAATIGFVLVMLGIHQDIQAKVYEEVVAMQELLKGRELESNDLTHFEYMDRVIKETLRLYPVGPVIFRECTSDVKLTTCTIPKGASVAAVILKTHRDPSIWKNPEEFDPDNFLPEKCEKRHPYAYIPFSAGPRNCIGKKYAYLSMRVMIYHILSKYKILCDLRVEDIKIKSEVTMKMVGGFKVRMLPRRDVLVK